jgi:nucleotide-binding universal stress UspA family protein
MENTLAIAAVWIGLALLASVLSVRLRLSVALVEILVGVAAGNLALLVDHFHALGRDWALPFDLKANGWIAFLAGFGSILLTFMAGAEIEPAVLRKFFKESMALGLAGFFGPFVGAMLYAHFVSGWDWNAAIGVGMVDEVDEIRRSAEDHFRRIGAAAVEYARSRGIALRSVVLRGHAADAIVRYAAGEAMNLVVLGQHGHSRIARFFLGSASDRVSERSPCTVMIVK